MAFQQGLISNPFQILFFSKPLLFLHACPLWPSASSHILSPDLYHCPLTGLSSSLQFCYIEMNKCKSHLATPLLQSSSMVLIYLQHHQGWMPSPISPSLSLLTTPDPSSFFTSCLTLDFARAPNCLYFPTYIIATSCILETTRITELIQIKYHYIMKKWCRFFMILVISEATQSCPTLCNPMDCSLPGSSLHGILQARILEWVAILVLNL